MTPNEEEDDQNVHQETLDDSNNNINLTTNGFNFQNRINSLK